MVDSSEVAVIGAGPYGLSVAAHLNACGVDFQIFGLPMHSWRAEMPAGMFLKSEAFASNLHDVEARYTLKRYCMEAGLDYADYGPAVPLDTFVAYGMDFQRKLVPMLQERSLIQLEQAGEGFLLVFDNGRNVRTRKVIVAVGTSPFRHVPRSLCHLPSELVSHSCQHHDLGRFKGQDVTVLGGGASALDLVALLHEAGARVRLVARQCRLNWNTKVERRALWRRWYPLCGLGGGDLRKRFYEHAPMLFRHLPQEARVKIVRTTLGPAGGYPIKECVEQREMLLRHLISSAEVRGSRLALILVNGEGTETKVLTDHLIAATGFRVSPQKLSFLSEKLRQQLSDPDVTARLTADFESLVRSLYFVGMASAQTFGPVMRFTLGARYTARRLAKHFARSAAWKITPARLDNKDLPAAG